VKYVGAHVSIAQGVYNAPHNAKKIGAKAFALFTKNQRQWTSKPLSQEEINTFKEACEKHNYSANHILPHDSYLINLGNPQKESLEKSRKAFIEEINRAHSLGLKFLNFHPGSHKRLISEDECLKLVTQSINISLAKTKNVILVIENTSGSGGHIGYSFPHLRALIDGVEDKTRIGICLDTCHAFAAGYDIRTKETYQKTMAEFDKTIGLKYLKAMHLNDSKVKLNSRKDRHHSLGKGEIGWDAFTFIMQDPRLDNIPLILETIDETLWIDEIKKLYSFLR
jgi:deoxyribonuclease-4